MADAARVRLLKIGRKEQPETLSAADVQRLLKVCRPRERAMVAFAASTGLRVDELLHLQWCDIDCGAGCVSVTARDGWKSKSHHERTGWFSESVGSILADYRETLKHSGPADWVFQGRRGARLTTAGKISRQVFERAGLCAPREGLV